MFYPNYSVSPLFLLIFIYISYFVYGDTDDVNRVQKDIRLGHSKTVENVMKMLADEGSLKGVTVCDAGCGTGSLSIPLAKEGAIVSASDISAAMVAEAEQKVCDCNVVYRVVMSFVKNY